MYLKRIVLMSLALTAAACGSNQNATENASMLSHAPGQSKINWKTMEGLLCESDSSKMIIKKGDRNRKFKLTASEENQKEYYQESVSRRRVPGYRSWQKFRTAGSQTIAYVNEHSLQAFVRLNGHWVSQQCKPMKPKPSLDNMFCKTAGEHNDYKMTLNYNKLVASVSSVKPNKTSSDLIDDKAKIDLRKSGLAGMVIGMTISAKEKADFSDGRCFDIVNHYSFNFNGIGNLEKGMLTIHPSVETNTPNCSVPRFMYRPLELKIECTR